ncbi:MAG: hypothetical protein IKN38_08015 [Clostridia bacterium]|nr:hypothetical protein [Clostridia bacterium]
MTVLGIDVGTTGTKTLALDERGEVLASSYREYELKNSGSTVSQNADDWWDAVCATVNDVASAVGPEKIDAISLSTQGASMLAASADGAALCEVMTWMDSRSAKEAECLDGAIGKRRVYEKCGWPLSPAGDAAKILWLKNNMPDVYDGASCFPSTIEFINKKLTGRFVTDPTNAAIRQLFNIKTGGWDDEILSAVGIARDKLPEIAPVGEEVGTLTDEASGALGLKPGVKVFCGAHDQYCAALGAGAVTAGDMMLATGTAWVVLGVTDAPLYTESGICPGIHPVKGKYGAMASLVSAGSALKWYKNLICDDFATMDREAAKRRDSAKDVLVLPYVAGAGFPHNRPDAGATIHGLKIGHDRYDIARSVMEGVAFEARGVIEEFAKNGMKIERLAMTGGAAKSDVWTGIVRDVTGCSIVRQRESETCCMGAAFIALVGLGVYKSYGDCLRFASDTSVLGVPDGESRAFYDEKYERYKGIRERIFS